MDVVEATLEFDRWLEQRLVIDESDLRYKHVRMAEDAFSFLRATFYRWAQLWPDLCPDLAAAPRVLGIGDLHVENFGTWRDSEGRLIWGVNDFDEAARLPYTQDLVRLCTSALISITHSRGRPGSLPLTSPRRACEAVLKGYRDALKKQGLPTVLAEHNRWLRDMAVGRLKEQRTYWDKMIALKPLAPVPRPVRSHLQRALPDRGLAMNIVKRRAGLGSLGRQRFTALAHWHGGLVAREVKALTTSAWWWTRGESQEPVRYAQIVKQAVRVADPFLRVHEGWVLRRLAPDCSRVELEHLVNFEDQCKLLHMMGWETANVHLGSKSQLEAVREDLQRRRGEDWLCDAASRMRDATFRDWRVWRRWQKKHG